LDTPGVTLKGTKDLDHLRTVLPVNMDGVQTHFVQSAMARDADAFEVAERFKIIGFKDVIFTRLDEAVQHGIIYNFQKHLAN
jgi:flagellar biosynthesis protein FlhF